MKKYNYAILILVGLLIFFSISTAQAQEEMEPDAPKQNFNQKQRPNLLSELDLSQNQIQQIRRINQESKLTRLEAQFRIREAQKALDQAIYADAADEVEIQTKLKNLQLAQAEAVKLRSMTEFTVRKVLTPEQLVKFREIRRRFMEETENRLNQPRNRQFNNPNKPFSNRRGRLRTNN
jgi:Spy/CpxP family protein refolding chaperone